MTSERRPGGEPPKYTEEASIEWMILNNAETVFASRSEKLRFDLVKRVLQWMLDTNGNNWFEKTSNPNQNTMPKRGWPHVRPSDYETKGYIQTLRNDMQQGCLTEELDVLSEYLTWVDDELPVEYRERRNVILDAIDMGDEERYRQRLKRFAENGRKFWFDK